MSCDVVANNTLGIHFNRKTNDNQLKIDDPIENFDSSDASTVVNLSLLKEEEKNVVRHQEYNSNGLKDDCSVCSELTVARDDILKHIRCNQDEKVAESFGHTREKLDSELDISEVTDRSVIDKWLDDSSPLILVPQNICRSKVFLLGVEPDIIEKRKPLDLISGYCYDGCKQFSEHSCIIWSHQNSCTTPLCPNCNGKDVEKELKLMFKFKINILDTDGNHAYVNVWKEQAEEFLVCSTKDFINNRWIQDTRMNFLEEISVFGSYYEKYTPLLDINVLCFEESLYLVHTRLLVTNKSS